MVVLKFLRYLQYLLSFFCTGDVEAGTERLVPSIDVGIVRLNRGFPNLSIQLFINRNIK